jgi:hypothetical protein
MKENIKRKIYLHNHNDKHRWPMLRPIPKVTGQTFRMQLLRQEAILRHRLRCIYEVHKPTTFLRLQL